MPDIMHLISFDAAPELVYLALTTAEGIGHWWTEDVDLDASAGGTGEFRFYDGKHVTRVRIERLEPSQLVRWSVVESFRPEWIGTTISFELRRSKTGTELLFSQCGYPEADDNYALCTTGWGIYFGRLQRHLDALGAM